MKRRQFFLNEADWRKVKDLAAKDGLPVSTWIRMQVKQAIARSIRIERTLPVPLSTVDSGFTVEYDKGGKK